MNSRDVDHVMIVFTGDIRAGDTDPALIIERPELDKLLANPLARAFVDSWLKNRMKQKVGA